MNHPRYKLILVSNRDEFYSRPTQPLDFWPDYPDILAGRDEQNRGTWLGLTRDGKFAAITNFRDPATLKSQAPSRGLLVSDYLTGDRDARDYMACLRSKAARFNGFNLLVGDKEGMYYLSSHGNGVATMPPGIHGLSNAFMNTPWPKVEKGKRELAQALDGQNDIPMESLFELMLDHECPPDNELPETGVGITWERILAPLFINSETYGTRSSALILVDWNDGVRFIERTYEKNGNDINHETRMFEWDVE